MHKCCLPTPLHASLWALTAMLCSAEVLRQARSALRRLVCEDPTLEAAIDAQLSKL